MADDDDIAARLDRRAADAADAWLADPRDVGVYARLVAAVAERRAALDAVVPDAPDTADGPDDAADTDADAGTDDEPDAPPLRPVGADLLGDPRAILERLRRG